ncbi:hypothetical protein [Petroclostridium sp. X23]|uniref:hypothetical protein n=1 Tax=Petroclostridium sp. X23 TaxID=3045146 RepID=UPI0024ACAB37|nr:hypothetical protein [Petroclostridium sp. X23]WHH61508.1 hypothetical protein QKW49_12755 [Petroclostridium sp. X23]
MEDRNTLLLEKKELSEKIYKNTLAQSESIADENIENLLILVESRQKLLDRIAGIDQGMEQYQRNAGKLQTLELDIINFFKQIYELDKENAENLAKIKEETFNRIQQVKHSKEAMSNGYMKQNISAYGYFLDKKK